MKHILLIVLLLFLCSCCSVQPNANLSTMLKQVTHEVWFKDGSRCNLTPIGAHTVLTATHCVDKAIKTIDIDKKGNSVVVLRKMYDKEDHVILLLAYTFKDWANISQESVSLGQSVFIAGAPGVFNKLYRVGVYSGRTMINHKDMMLFQLPIFYGDSGSAIFNQQGQIITTITCNASLTGDNDYVGFACANPLAFTKHQLEQIQ